MKKNIRSGYYDDGEVHGTENWKGGENNWRGVPGVHMIWHGEWADPELEYEGKIANYWDIEDAMYEWATEDGVNVDSDEAFNKYCQEHDYDVYALFDNYPIESGCHGKSKKDDKKDKDDKKKPVKSAMPGREKYIQAVMEEYGCTREEAEEIIAEDIQSSRKSVKSGLMDKTKEEQVDQLYDKIWYDVDRALNEICFKYQEILGIHTGDSWEVLDPDTPTENIVAVLKDQLIHFVK